MNELEIREKLATMPLWQYANGKIRRELSFSNYQKTVGFFQMIALHAERVDHHPDCLVLYGRLVIELSTHDVNGISQRDLEFASHVESLLRAPL